jgi:hypothetical protein
MREFYAKFPYVFVDVDPLFASVLGAIGEARDSFKLLSTGEAHLKSTLESDNKDNARVFGGAATRPSQGFARTASSVARMLMVRATGIQHLGGVDRLFGSRSKGDSRKRNLANTVVKIPDKPLTNDEDEANYFTTRYDHLLPHFLVEWVINQSTAKESVTLNPFMIVINYSSGFVAQLSTTLTVKKDEPPYEFATLTFNVVYASYKFANLHETSKLFIMLEGIKEARQAGSDYSLEVALRTPDEAKKHDHDDDDEGRENDDEGEENDDDEGEENDDEDD